MLRVTDVMLRNLIWKMVTFDIHQRQNYTNNLDRLIAIIRSYGTWITIVHFVLFDYIQFRRCAFCSMAGERLHWQSPEGTIQMDISQWY